MNQIAPRETSINSVSVATGSNGSSIAPQNLGEVVRFAEVMCKADIALPQHLRGNAGACMAVAMQALEWQMSPFAVASKSYAVGGRIAYEAQLIAAVVNTRSGIKGRLKYQFDGEGAAMTCTVTGTLDGEDCVYKSPTIGSITVKNSPLWKSDPQQQLGYFSARSWARRHCPEVLLGVYDRDEVENYQGADNAKDVTPQPSIMQRLASNKPQGAQEGFDADNVTRETETLTSGQFENTEQSELPHGSDAEGGVNAEHSDPALENTAQADQPGEELDPPASSEPGSTNLTDEDKDHLLALIKRLKAAIGPDEAVIIATGRSFAAEGNNFSDIGRAKAQSLVKIFRDVCRGEIEESTATELACGIAQIDALEVA